jgi:hypothetical protein
VLRLKVSGEGCVWRLYAKRFTLLAKVGQRHEAGVGGGRKRDEMQGRASIELPPNLFVELAARSRALGGGGSGGSGGSLPDFPSPTTQFHQLFLCRTVILTPCGCKCGGERRTNWRARHQRPFRSPCRWRLYTATFRALTLPKWSQGSNCHQQRRKHNFFQTPPCHPSGRAVYLHPTLSSYASLYTSSSFQ